MKIKRPTGALARSKRLIWPWVALFLVLWLAVAFGVRAASERTPWVPEAPPAVPVVVR